jgi:hypothetical protein
VIQAHSNFNAMGFDLTNPLRRAPMEGWRKGKAANIQVDDGGFVTGYRAQGARPICPVKAQ